MARVHDERTTVAPGIEAHVEEARRLALPLRNSADLDPLLDATGDASFVLLGEASHGTHEYYTWRAEITKRLIVEKGFSFVAVEGDWPECYRINRWVKGSGKEPADAALQAFERWPTWMWANKEVAEFIAWLRDHNESRSPAEQVGFYGLDVYSLWDSIRAVLDYLEEHDPTSIGSALRAWRCFEPYGKDPQEYAWATRLVPTSCEAEVVEVLARLRRDAAKVGEDAEARFDAEQNAAVAAGAERYYRAMVRGGAASWNIRDIHMADTLDRLVHRHGKDSKAVVWEHNTHIGDARATDMSASGMVNVGQIVRDRHGADDVLLVGFGSYEGEVIAAHSWGTPMDNMPVPPARPGSHEDVLHRTTLERALFIFPKEASEWLRARREHRAIGVVYHPEFERVGNYVPTVLGRRYDAFCFLDRTTALRPLSAEVAQPRSEQETFPFGG